MIWAGILYVIGAVFHDHEFRGQFDRDEWGWRILMDLLWPVCVLVTVVAERLGE
jgi:predicted membrane channel-forming protein YqfA (hemolysin III family)